MIQKLKLHLFHFDYTVHFYYNSKISQPHPILKDTSYRHRIILRAYEFKKSQMKLKLFISQNIILTGKFITWL